ncbi:MAG TPA: hypothetical protein VG055_01285 [Planctomycetaceae bacterium]|jgi:hypothetical protein|nr:hypothetical protein [Planctomycetaceae bacterium]
MKTFWFGAACVVACVITVWYSRTTYGDPPKTPEGPRMIAMDGGIILDANQILFIQDTGLFFHIAFKGVNIHGNNTFPVLEVRTTPENRKRLAVATGVVLRPPDEDREERERNAKRAVK